MTTMVNDNQEFQDAFLQYAIIFSALIALCTGYLTWSFKRMFIVYAFGVFCALLVVIPDWDFFTSRPIREWIEPMPSDQESRLLQRARFPILKKTAKYAKREDIHPVGIIFAVASFSYSAYFSWKFVTS